MRKFQAILYFLILIILSSGSFEAQTRKSKIKKKKAKVVKVDTAKIIKLPPQKAPIVPFRDTIFYIYGKSGSFSPEQRAKAIEERIRNIEKDPFYSEDSIKLFDMGSNIDITYKNNIIATIDTVQALALNKTKTEVSQNFSDEISKSIQKQREETSIKRKAIQIGGVLAIIIAEFLLIKLIFYAFRRLKIHVWFKRGKKIDFFWGLLNAQRLISVINWFLNVVKLLLIITSLYFCLLILFKLFPYTISLSDQLLSYVVTPLKSIGKKVKDYLPNLFMIFVITLIFWYIKKLLRSLTQQIADNKISIKGFYPDWAFPTYNIITTVMFIFMFILIYPYLPQSNSAIFQGVSVFAGVLISLGSTSLIGNLIAGLVITYMRPFKIGDRIKIEDCIGNVVEKSALITRIKTIKNEIITIPNSSIMSAKTINYSQSAQTHGLILYTSVTISYSIPWEKVNELLLIVASRTKNLSQEQKPFILQNSLDDFYVDYQLNVYTKDANKMMLIYSDLRKNIQEVFKEAGIDLLSPHYSVNKNVSEVTIKSGNNQKV